MRISVILTAALLVGGIYYIQNNPHIEAKLHQFFSYEHLLTPKFDKMPK